MGEAQGAPTGQHEREIALAVGVEGDGGAVPGERVALHDEPPGGPGEVAGVALDDDVVLRLLEAVAVAELGDEVLELAARIARAGIAGERCAQRRGTGAARMASQEGVEVGEAEQAELLGAADGGAQSRRGKRGGEVEQRPGRRGDRQAVEPRDLVRGEPPAMEPDAVPRSSAGWADGDVQQPAAGHEAVRRRGAAIAEDAVRRVREHRRPAPPADGEVAVPDRVDAALERMQSACGDPARDRGPRQPCREELPDPDDAALSAGKSGDRGADVAFVTHGET